MKNFERRARRAATIVFAGLVGLYALDGCDAVLGLGDLSERSADAGAGDATMTVDESGTGKGQDAGRDSAARGDGAAADGMVAPRDAHVGDDHMNPDAVSTIPDGCATQQVNAEAGVFTIPDGGNDTTCGAITSPCGSVTAALKRAQATGKSIIYVARAGSPYVETLNLFANITIQGGWTVQGTTWTPVCTGSPASGVVVQAPDTANTTVTAASLEGTASLETLTIMSKASNAVQPGESIYGVLASGSSTTLNLRNVLISVVSGGGGTGGVTGSSGAAGSDAGCEGGTGASGVTGANGAGSDGGTFGPSGASGGAGAPGHAGTNGHDGTDGGPGSSSTNCYASCGGAPSDCMPGPFIEVSTAAGSSGCGGGAGDGGTPGHGGGSSFALYCWGATVNVTGGVLTAASGGSGGQGGMGGGGGAGGLGQGVAAEPCATICEDVDNTCSLVYPSSAYVPGSDAGGPGGTGGAGGQGGGGAGGWACSYYTGGSGMVTTSGTGLLYGDAGPGGQPGGAAGMANGSCP